MTWKPIETAPKDGSHVLLYGHEIQFVGYYGGANSGWRINAPGLPAALKRPTHWMPLPETPNAKLKDCPFCGKPAKVYETTKPMDVGCVWYAACSYCQIGTARCYSKSDAVMSWNRRTALPRQSAVLNG